MGAQVEAGERALVAGNLGGWASLFSANVIAGNIYQSYLSNKSGRFSPSNKPNSHRKRVDK